MKKILPMFLAVSLVLSSAFVTYAEKKSDTRGKGHEVTEQTSESTAVESEEANADSADGAAVEKDLDTLRQQLKENKRNKEERKKLIKEIVDLRKQQNDSSIPVVVNGEEVKFDVPPVIKSNRTLIPVRAVTNALGADVQWDRETNMVSVTKAVYGESVTDSVYGEPTKIEIKINLNDGSVTVNGESVSLDVPPQVVNNRTMVPIRFIAETFDMIVDWDRDTGAVFIDEDDDATAETESSDVDTGEQSQAQDDEVVQTDSTAVAEQSTAADTTQSSESTESADEE